MNLHTVEMGSLENSMQAKDAFAALGAAEKIAAALYKVITGDRGIKRTLVMELQENIEHIRLYVESDTDPKKLIPDLSETVFRNALADRFNFNSLQRSAIATRSTRDLPQLRKYHGWKTQRVFENVYQKVATLKHAVNITDSKKPVLIGVRLNNVFMLMVMLATHIGGDNDHQRKA